MGFYPPLYLFSLPEVYFGKMSKLIWVENHTQFKKETHEEMHSKAVLHISYMEDY